MKHERTIGGFVVVLITICCFIAGTTPSALATADETYAPLDRAGPALSVAPEKLAQSLKCSRTVAPGTRAVLLTPPTFFNDDEAYPAYEDEFRREAIPYCTMALPNATSGDSQTNAEYFVYAVRRIHQITGKKVTQLGWSQGASMYPRWGFRFFPDVRRMVGSSIELSAVTHGALCNTFSVVTSVPALHQCKTSINPATVLAEKELVTGQSQQHSPHIPLGNLSKVPRLGTSKFIEAENSRQETFPGINYTVLYSKRDPFASPPTRSSALPGGPNVANVPLQSVCPHNVATHFDFPEDPVAFSLAMDAVRNPDRPANIHRVDRQRVCNSLTPPNVSYTQFVSRKSYVYTTAVKRLYTMPQTTSEPPLRCYVYDRRCDDFRLDHGRSRATY